MEKVCFAIYEDENDSHKQKVICAHEKDYEGSGCYIAIDFDKFDKANSNQKIDMMNDMIVAVLKAHEVKKEINFKDYQRNESK